MAFTTFTASTTAYATEVMDNFYFIYQDDRMPFNSNFSLTADTYNIGSSSQRWRKVYVNNIDTSGVTTSSNLVNSIYNTTTAASTSTAIDITFPDYSSDYGFNIYAEFSGDFTTTIDWINITFNSITTSTYTSSFSNIVTGYNFELTTGGFDVGRDFIGLVTITSDTTSTYYFKANGVIHIFEGQTPTMDAEVCYYGVSNSALIGSIVNHIFATTILSDTSTITTMNVQFNGICQNHKIAIWELD